MVVRKASNIQCPSAAFGHLGRGRICYYVQRVNSSCTATLIGGYMRRLLPALKARPSDFHPTHSPTFPLLFLVAVSYFLEDSSLSLSTVMADAAQPAVDPLAHLPRCTECEFHLSAPKLCEGRKHPEHVDFWYRHVSTCIYYHPSVLCLMFLVPIVVSE